MARLLSCVGLISNRIPPANGGLKRQKARNEYSNAPKPGAAPGKPGGTRSFIMPLRTRVETGLLVRALAGGPMHEAPAGLFKRGAAANEDGTEVRVQRQESCRTRTVVRGAGLCRPKADPGLELFEACYPLTEARRTRNRRCHLRERARAILCVHRPCRKTETLGGGLFRTLVIWSWTESGARNCNVAKPRHEVGAQGMGIRIPKWWKGVDPVVDQRLRIG